MKRKALVVTALLVAAGSSTAAAQGCNILCSPIFVAQPGVVVANAINAPEFSQGVRPETATEFLFRVTTVVPTQLPRTALVGIIQWTPFASARVEGIEHYSNAPAFVYGPVFTLVQAGPVALTFDVLGAYGPSGVVRNGKVRDYEHQLLLEFDVGVNLGQMMMGGNAPPFLRNLSAYGFLAQQMTDRPANFRGERVYSPVMLFGLTIPVAPLP